jgi:leader peptidase (prepilin peptidase)/N-methyltransferase
LGSGIGVAIMVIQRKKDLKFEIPFGPFLAIGALLHLYFGNRILEAFFNLSGSQGG